MPRTPARMGARRRGDPFPTLFDLRKGAPKPTEGYGFGAELDYFRPCMFDEQDAELVAFIESLGPKPNHLGFVFPAPNVEDNLMFFNECYKGKIMIHRCTPDEDRIVLKAIDPVTFKPTVLNGRDVNTGEIVRCNDQPIYSYASKKSGQVNVYCSPVVRLKVMLRGQGRIGIVDVLSTSAWDGEHLTHQLETFHKAFAGNRSLNGLMGVPFILHRTPMQDVPYYDENGVRKTSRHSFISIEIAPEFGARFMESAVHFALKAVEPMKALKSGGPEWVDDEILDAVSSAGNAAMVITGNPQPDAPADISDSPPSDPLPTAQVEQPAQPKTAPKTPGKPVKMASTKFTQQTVAEWNAAVTAFVAENPNWQTKAGKPDMAHIQASAAHAGFAIIDGDNRAEVFHVIKAAHEAKATDANAAMETEM